MKSLIVNAGPGTGKTSTIEDVLNVVYSGKTPTRVFSEEQQNICDWVLKNFPKRSKCPHILALAFNKSIATELQERLGYGEAKTIHSLGAGLCYKNLRKIGKPRMDSWKTTNIFCGIVEAKSTRVLSKIQREILDEVKTMVSWCKDYVIKPDEFTQDQLEQICADKEYVSETYIDVLYDYVKQILTIGTEGPKLVSYDFDDMLYLPNLNGWKDKFDGIIVDEAQDLSVGRRTLILNQVCNHYLWVGDTNQSIYGFAGADCSSLANIGDITEADHLPLSTTYRCAKAIVSYAKTFQTEGGLVAAPSAPEGSISTITSETMRGQLSVGDLVLCRVNAPIVSIAWGLLRDGKPAHIIGRSLGKSLKTIVKKCDKEGAAFPAAFLESVNAWADKQIKILDKKPWCSDEAKASVEDQRNCIFMLTEGASSTEEILSNIDSLFESDPNKCTRLSSIHRAKGLESDKVYWYNPANTPHPMAKTPEAMKQERNLQFVAVSRTKTDLYLVTPPKKQELEK
jgi:superfamily I DNA/RNA helicase